MTMPPPKTKFEKHFITLETVHDAGNVIVRLGLVSDSPRWDRATDHECPRELGFGMELMPNEALQFALGIIQESWAAARDRLGPLLELGIRMGWLEQKDVYDS